MQCKQMHNVSQLGASWRGGGTKRPYFLFSVVFEFLVKVSFCTDLQELWRECALNLLREERGITLIQLRIMRYLMDTITIYSLLCYNTSSLRYSISVGKGRDLKTWDGWIASSESSISLVAHLKAESESNTMSDVCGKLYEMTFLPNEPLFLFCNGLDDFSQSIQRALTELLWLFGVACVWFGLLFVSPYL